MGLPKWLEVLAKVGPEVLLFTPLAPIAGEVVSAIALAESMQGASGADKLAKVVAIATDAAQAVNTQAGRTVIDPAVLATTAATAISTAVNVTNMVHAAHVNPTAPAPTAVIK